MIFAVICAGGKGNRMGNTEKPKQFLNLGGKPVILHTLEKFVINDKFEKILVLSPKTWINHTLDIIKKYTNFDQRIEVLEGGSDRNSTIMNAIRYIEDNYGLDDDTIIVTHDAVRRFVTYRMIEENIEKTIRYGACDTVIPATDTIVESNDGVIISNVPERNKLYQGQTPQSFKAKKLKELFLLLTDEEKAVLTDAAKIYAINGEPVYLVNGDVSNIKITYSYDLKIAENLILDKEE